MNAYLRRWLPYWIHCALFGLAIGVIIGVTTAALAWPAVSPVFVVILAAALRHLHTTHGTRTLTTTARRALGHDKDTTE